MKSGDLEILSHSVAQPRLLSDAVFLRDQKSVSAASLMSAEARGRNVPCEFSTQSRSNNVEIVHMNGSLSLSWPTAYGYKSG